jgi:hypothetical protein
MTSNMLSGFGRASRRLAALAPLAIASYATAAVSADADTPAFSFSGFGTLGVVHSSESRADYSTGTIRPNGAGYSHDWSADVDSRLGAQVTADFTQNISAVMQVIVEQRHDKTYIPTIEWLNVKYQFTPDFSLRAGRIVLPAFLVSDYRKVGYANQWLRPAVEVYDLIPITNGDGVDVSYRASLGEFRNTLQGIYFRTNPKLPAGQGTAKARDGQGLVYTGEYGGATARIAHIRGKTTLDAFEPLFDALGQFGPEGAALVDKYGADNKLFTFTTIGGSYDSGNWYAMGEWGVADLHNIVGKRSAWYVSGGYRLGAFTPYVTYAKVKKDSNASDPGLTVSALPPFLAGPAAALNAALNTTLASSPVQQTISVGGRWDFAKNAAFKLQADHIRLGAGSSGTLINVQPDFQPGGKVNVFSATIDFVF